MVAGCIFHSEPRESHWVSVLSVAQSLWRYPGVRPVMWLLEPQCLHLYSGVVMATLPGLGAQSLALSPPNAARVGYFWVEGCLQPLAGAGAGEGDTAAGLSRRRGPAGTRLLIWPRTSCFRCLLSFCLSFTTQPIFNFRRWGRGGRALWQRFFLSPSLCLFLLGPPCSALPTPHPPAPPSRHLSFPPALPPGSLISHSLLPLPAPPLSGGMVPQVTAI